MELLLSITIFTAFGAAFVLVNMLMGALARPQIPNPEKAAVYECGEPTIGSSWVQFDLRFYIVALVYLIFDVEVALFYPSRWWTCSFSSACCWWDLLTFGGLATSTGYDQRQRQV
jgi:NADH-quinone oxidoreductase subunit A